jgi:putative Holliday junction resolvase
MGRLMALDVGDVKVGVAMTDALNITAQPVDTVFRKKGDLPQPLKEIIKKYDIDKIIVGLPLNMDGTEGGQAKKTKKFIDLLLKENLCDKDDIIYLDERLTSAIAKQSMIALGAKPSRNKGAVDKISAVILLQNYMSTKF